MLRVVEISGLLDRMMAIRCCVVHAARGIAGIAVVREIAKRQTLPVKISWRENENSVKEFNISIAIDAQVSEK